MKTYRRKKRKCYWRVFILWRWCFRMKMLNMRRSHFLKWTKSYLWKQIPFIINILSITYLWNDLYWHNVPVLFNLITLFTYFAHFSIFKELLNTIDGSTENGYLKSIKRIYRNMVITSIERFSISNMNKHNMTKE
jgi:hypothetical protein